jgi:predicted phage terminase large subunit-like protein
VRDLIINIPPGFMKSLLGAVFWPAWVWTFLPGWRGLFCSYAIDLALRDSVKCRTLIESDWYQATFRPTWGFAGDQNVKSYFANTAMGFRLCVSVGGRATGFRGHAVVVDDPLNASDAYSENARTEATTWWDRSMSSRVNDKRTGTRVVIMQRLHEEDLTGHLVKRGGYDHLCLPLEYEPQRKAVTSIGWEDPRTEAGACLFPEMFPPEVIAQTQRELGSDYPGQYQQRPSSAEGDIFQRGWFAYYDTRPPKLHQVLLSCDPNVKETKKGSYMVVQVWGRVHADLYLLGQVRARLDFPAMLDAIRWCARFPVGNGQRAEAKLIEDKANGPAAIATLKREIPGIIAVPAEASKEARWRSASPYVRSGNVFLPGEGPAAAWTRALQEVAAQPKSWLAPADVKSTWVGDFVDELAGVPASAANDQADTATQAILFMVRAPSTGAKRERRRDGSHAGGAIAAME